LFEVKQMMRHIKSQGKTSIAFKTKRADKRFPMTSVEVNSRFGEEAKKIGLKVDYSGAEDKIFVEITHKKCFICQEGLTARLRRGK